MPNIAVIAAPSGAGRVSPAKPTLTHYTTTGQFQITNYDANLTYTLSVTAGTATRSDDIITMSNANSICTVTATGPKSLEASTAATAERKAYTYSFNVTGGYYHNTPADGYAPNFGQGPDGSSTYFCQQVGSDPNGCYHEQGTNQKAATPSGYTDSYNEWWKVT